MDELMNKNVEYQVVNDQIQLIVKDVQAPQSKTVAWPIGMDPATTNCKELAKILCGFRQFRKLPIHGKLQQLCIRKKDDKLDWNHPQRIDVVTIQCAHYLHKTIVKTLRKIFNSTKPKDVENRPNDTNAKCVPCYSDCNSLDQSTVKLATTMVAKK